MPYRFKDARIQSGMSQKDAANHLLVSAATINNWESGRRLPTIEALEKMADLYGVTTDYLLGRDEISKHYKEISTPVGKECLHFMHDCPVFVNNHRWGIVNTSDSLIHFSDGQTVSFSNIQSVSTLPQAIVAGYIPYGEPLELSNIELQEKIWVEPISHDEILRTEMRGWYTVKSRYVENEFGQRFYFDTYGNKWLAFILEP